MVLPQKFEGLVDLLLDIGGLIHRVDLEDLLHLLGRPICQLLLLLERRGHRHLLADTTVLGVHALHLHHHLLLHQELRMQHRIELVDWVLATVRVLTRWTLWEHH